jgi:hypothetical protein
MLGTGEIDRPAEREVIELSTKEKRTRSCAIEETRTSIRA